MSRPMRIAEVSQYYHPYRGGQETYVRQLSRKLTEKGHQVTVLTTTETKPGDGLDSQIQIVRLPAPLTILNNPIAVRILKEYRGLSGFDIIHLHNEHSFLTIALTGLKSRVSPPIALTLHGQLRFGMPPLDFLRSVYSITVGNLVLRSADLVFVNSPEDYVDTLSRGVRKEELIQVSNAVDRTHLSGFISSKSREKVRETLSVPADMKLILYVGRLITRKGIGTLLAAFKKCLAVRSDILLLIIGDGPLRPVCENAYEAENTRGHITTMSNVPSDFLYKCYQAADVFVLPSVSEVCPTVLLEALFFGCRVVASDIPGIRDHFDGLSTLVKPGDIAGFARAILRNLGESHGGKLETRGRRRLPGEYDWNLVATTYASAFETALDALAPRKPPE